MFGDREVRRFESSDRVILRTDISRVELRHSPTHRPTIPRLLRSHHRKAYARVDVRYSTEQSTNGRRSSTAPTESGLALVPQVLIDRDILLHCMVSRIATEHMLMRSRRL